MFKIHINNLIKIFIVGTIFGVLIFVSYMTSIDTRAAGVGTGGADLNSRYLDGYGTSSTTTANKIYVSDANGYLPQVIPTGMTSMFDTSCPTGWTRVSALDGKFLAGGASYSATAGGSDSITLSVSQLPSHTHTGTTGSDGVHAHTFTAGDHGGSYSSSLSHGGNTSNNTTIPSDGAHTHAFTTDGTGSGASIDTRPAYATIVICKKD
jgi:hypothetical protein